MRLVQIIVPEGKKEAIIELLEEKGIDFVITPETSSREYSDVLFFPLPKEGLEEVIDELRSAGLESDGYTVICKAEAVVAKRFEELKEKYSKAEATDESKVAREELKANAEELMASNRFYFLMTVIASVIATAGIILDNAAVVVGSMVIAPLIGPAMASCVGTVIADDEMFKSGVFKQLTGVGAAIASSALFARLALTVFTPHTAVNLLNLGQLTAQIHPGFLSMAIALGSGFAGAFSMMAGVSTALVGVMIAVALIPPAATVGIGVATLRLEILFGASFLLLVNVISINLAGTLALWYEGYKPGKWYKEKGAKKITKQRGVWLAVALLVIAAFLGYTTWNADSNARTLIQVRETLQKLATGRGGNLLSMTENYKNIVPRRIESIRATIAVPKGDSSLAVQARELIHEKIDQKLDIEVLVLQSQEASPG